MTISELDTLIALPASGHEKSGRIASLPNEEIDRIIASRSITPSEFFDLFAREIAHRYTRGVLSFGVASAAMKALYSYALHNHDAALPSYALEVFVAFDEGEYFHAGDAPYIDPEEQYTRPKIRSIVARDRIPADAPDGKDRRRKTQ